MPLRRLGRSAREAWEVPRDLLLGRYPAFVTGGALPRGDVPVFVFHGAEPDSFARKLAHLADNGYVTLSADEYVAVLRGQRKPEERAVVLTFDDGRGSVWSVAAPLLRRHGMKAVVFLVPGRIPSRPGARRPTWDDVESGRADAASLLRREEGDGALLSWEEIEALAADGPLRLPEPHPAPRPDPHRPAARRLRHAPLPARVRRVRPAAPRGRRAGPPGRGGPARHAAPALRPPHLRGAALLRGPGRAGRLRGRGRESGGEGFFLRADWEARLRRVFGRTHVTGRVETPDERARAIRRELAESRRLIEERTGRSVVHLCYPWHAAGPTARRLALEAGYETAFCGKVPGVPITRPGGDPRAIARIGEDYVELLPGRGRATLAEVLRRKWARRFGGALR